MNYYYYLWNEFVKMQYIECANWKRHKFDLMFDLYEKCNQ